MSIKLDKAKGMLKKVLVWSLANKRKAGAAVVTVAAGVGYTIDPVMFQGLLTLLEIIAV